MIYDTARREPTTSGESRPSGRFVLRISPDLHASLREAARVAGTSLNDYCGRKLAAPRGPMDPEAVAVVERAVSMLGESLLGVVACGSWARGEAAASSDLDVLLIADDKVPIARALYGNWDDGPALRWDGHEVTPHFVHLPTRGESVSGLWAEVAQDGLVLFERELVVSRQLANVRRRILCGEMSLRVAGGQRYWVHSP